MVASILVPIPPQTNIIFPSNHTLSSPSALPSSLPVSILLAVTRKNGPKVCNCRSRFCALDVSMISDIDGNEVASSLLRSSVRLSEMSCLLLK
ncbi:hypothetical protein Leryth_016016 [Lithospermum erythrorhizon]|nr:hypothetical protein Leryth_016016 [Lithospermum erythrorhizon]